MDATSGVERVCAAALPGAGAIKGENRMNILLVHIDNGYRFWIEKWCFSIHSFKRDGFGSFIAYSERHFDGRGIGWPPDFLMGFYIPIKFWKSDIFLIWKTMGIRTSVRKSVQ